MANSNRPFGLKPTRHMSGAPWNGATRLFCVVPAAAHATTNTYFIGDAVTKGTTTDVNGIPSVLKYAAGGTGATSPIGVVVGVHKIRPTKGSLEGKTVELEEKALTGNAVDTQYLMVCVDHDVIYEVQSDATGLSSNNVGNNVELTVTAPSNKKQFSAVVCTAPNTTITLPYSLIGFKQTESNEVNATASVAEPFIVALGVANQTGFQAGQIGLA